MVTTPMIIEFGRDAQGRWRPSHMTHHELAEELKTATGDRRAELAAEARQRMKQAGYPRFPAYLGLADAHDDES